jgi:hypothetical protein
VLEGDTQLNSFAGCYRPWPKIPRPVHFSQQQKIRKVDRRAERSSGQDRKESNYHLRWLFTPGRFERCARRRNCFYCSASCGGSGLRPFPT